MVSGISTSPPSPLYMEIRPGSASSIVKSLSASAANAVTLRPANMERIMLQTSSRLNTRFFIGSSKISVSSYCSFASRSFRVPPRGLNSFYFMFRCILPDITRISKLPSYIIVYFSDDAERIYPIGEFYTSFHRWQITFEISAIYLKTVHVFCQAAQRLWLVRPAAGVYTE